MNCCKCKSTPIMSRYKLCHACRQAILDKLIQDTPEDPKFKNLGKLMSDQLADTLHLQCKVQ